MFLCGKLFLMRVYMLVAVLLSAGVVTAQSKKELQAEISRLKTENKTLQDKVSLLEAVKNPTMEEKHSKASYSLGVLIGTNVDRQGIDSLNRDAMFAGMQDVLSHKPTKITLEECNTIVREYITQAVESKSKEMKAAGEAFLTENKTKAGIKVTPSGLQYKINKSGTGKTPLATSEVTVHYVGTRIDGLEFESSIKRGEPATFKVFEVIPGWTEALQLMKEGDNWTIFLPSDLGYGDRGSGEVIPPGAVLIFEIELLKVN